MNTRSTVVRREKNVLLSYLLGVDRGVGIVEGPDYIVSEPGTRHDGTEAWESTEKRSVPLISHIQTCFDPLHSRQAAAYRLQHN